MRAQRTGHVSLLADMLWTLAHLRLPTRSITIALEWLGPLWLLLSCGLLVTDDLGWLRPMTVTLPPFLFACGAILMAHRSRRLVTPDLARWVLLLSYCETVIFGILLGVGLNVINDRGWGG